MRGWAGLAGELSHLEHASLKPSAQAAVAWESAALTLVATNQLDESGKRAERLIMKCVELCIHAIEGGLERSAARQQTCLSCPYLQATPEHLLPSCAY